MWNPSTCDCNCDKSWKIEKYFDIKDCSCKRRLFGKLVLACKDEVLNTTGISLDHKIVTREKNNCDIHAISSVFICLLSLVFISVSCCYYYTRHWIKKRMTVCIRLTIF